MPNTFEVSSSVEFDSTNIINSEESGETTHLSVVDAEGNLVAVTSSINAYFGAKAVSPTLGFLYNTYMDDFNFEEKDHPIYVGSEKMAFSSMSPTIVKREGINVMAIGSPGSARIISAIFQILVQWIDEHQPIEEIVRAPRLHVDDPSIYFENIEDSIFISPLLTGKNIRLTLEPVQSDLSIRGLNAYFGGIHVVAFEGNMWKGVADPRRDGTVRSSADH